MRLGIGIDTGGTYTDAVLYDFDTGTIIDGSKSLTTKDDLSKGILSSIDKLDREKVKQAQIISLSTTLATNACVEDKGGKAKLVFFGGDPNTIDQYGKPYGLPKSDDIHIQPGYTTFSGAVEREPDWNEFLNAVGEISRQYDGLGIIEMNAMRNGAVVEKQAKKLVMDNFDIPVVCGHELFSELNCLQRGSSTLLNASLFSVIKHFISAVKKSLSERDINPQALVIVRSDGSLMNEEFASLRPVETLLCGPAASAIGCANLVHEKNSIVVDMGGTTTDIAIIKDGNPVKVVDGVSIGKWKTFVNGLYVKTFGLGGDSAVHYCNNAVKLEDYRVIPICNLAYHYPQILDNIQKIEIRKHTHFLYEHFVLTSDIPEGRNYTKEETALCELLKKEGPLQIQDAAGRLGTDIYNLDTSRLQKDGIVTLSGLTPTDIMHIRGDFSKFSKEASLMAAKFVAYNLGITVDELCEQVYREVERKLYVNIVKALMENKYSSYLRNGIPEDVDMFISDTFSSIYDDRDSALLTSVFRTRFKLVGVGAPIQVFLDDVARMLGTEAVIPPYHEVANALGAVMGSINASCTIEIDPIYDLSGIKEYRIYTKDGNLSFDNIDDAKDTARKLASNIAFEEARKRGAVGEISVTYSTDSSETQGYGDSVYLGSAITATAIGSIEF